MAYLDFEDSSGNLLLESGGKLLLEFGFGSKLRHRRIYEIEEPYNDDDEVFLIIKKIVLSGVLER